MSNFLQVETKPTDNIVGINSPLSPLSPLSPFEAPKFPRRKGSSLVSLTIDTSRKKSVSSLPLTASPVEDSSKIEEVKEVPLIPSVTACIPCTPESFCFSPTSPNEGEGRRGEIRRKQSGIRSFPGLRKQSFRISAPPINKRLDVLKGALPNPPRTESILLELGSKKRDVVAESLKAGILSNLETLNQLLSNFDMREVV
jgi:hypothetical protein